MAFTQRLGDLDLISSALTGMSAHRKQLWTRTLEDCKELFMKRGLSQEINNKAVEAIDSLRGKGTASSHSPAALSIYRYIGEGLIRSTLSMAYEDKLPFDWSFNWSGIALQEVMIRISTFIAPLNLHRTSSLLPHFPISVLASAMHMITRSGADNLSWWKDSENVRALMRKAKNMAKGFSGKRVLEKDKTLIADASSLFAEGLSLLEFMTGTKTVDDIQGEGIPKLKSLLCRRYEDNRTQDVIPPFLFAKEKILEIWNLLLNIDPTLGQAMGLWIDVQLTYLNANQHSVLTNVCRNIVTNQRIVQMMSLDNIVLDLAFMYSDINKTIKILSSEENEVEVGQLMTVLAEPWDEDKLCNHRKLFMLAIALMQGIDSSTVDNILLVNGIMEKLGDDGSFSSTRKKRTKLSSRQTKRAPKLQPRVIYSRPLSDSEDEYTSRNHRKKRSRLNIKRITVSDSEDSEGDDPAQPAPRNTAQAASIPENSHPSAAAEEQDDTPEVPSTGSAQPAPTVRHENQSPQQGCSEHVTPSNTPSSLTPRQEPPDASRDDQNSPSTSPARERDSTQSPAEKTQNREKSGFSKNPQTTIIEECGLQSPLQDESSPSSKSPRQKRVRFMQRNVINSRSPQNLSQDASQETSRDSDIQNSNNNRNNSLNLVEQSRSSGGVNDVAKGFARPKPVRRSTRKRRKTKK